MEYKSKHLNSYSTRVPSSKGDTHYTVSFGKSEYEDDDAVLFDWKCTCPDWEFRRKFDGTYCKHIDAVKSTAPDLGGSSSWVSTQYQRPIFVVSEDALINAKDLMNSDELQEALQVIFNDVIAYVPPHMTGGALVEAIPDEEEQELRDGGVLEALEYAIWSSYVTLYDKDDMYESYRKLLVEMLRDKGINANAVFQLSDKVEDEFELCGSCGEPLVYIPPFHKSFANETYLCANKDCEKSVNHQNQLDKLTLLLT